ncbi:MAG TPA: methyltransferase domain-containing protein [Chryseolinea sp.]|nr:methyltransferase domain-containing protein [Chryseolinea sp.]
MFKKKLKSILTRFRYRGNTYTCPICGYHAKSFLPAGLYAKRANEKCPSCGSLTRHRHVWLFLEEYLKAKQAVRILHFSPEKPIADRLVKREGVEYKTSQYDRNVSADYYLDIQAIDLPDNQFDIIICSHVSEHIPDDRKAMREVYRILKPGGIAIVLVPLWPSEKHATYENPAITDERDRIMHFGQYDHLRIYGLDVVDRLKEAGFKIEIIDMEKRIDELNSKRYRLHNMLDIRELIFLSGK